MPAIPFNTIGLWCVIFIKVEAIQTGMVASWVPPATMKFLSADIVTHNVIVGVFRGKMHVIREVIKENKVLWAD